MAFAILQKELTRPSVDQLKRAFRSIQRLTQTDAYTLGKDAFGVLVKNFSLAEANTLQRALAAEGVQTEVVDERSLPVLPPTKFLKRADCLPDALRLYDALGRPFPLEWGHITLIAAGNAQLTEFARVETVRLVSHYSEAGGLQHSKEVAVSRKEQQNYRCLIDLFLTGAVMRYSISADSFNFSYLESRRSSDLMENYLLLVRDLIQFAPQATLNRGAYSIREGAPLMDYPSKNAFFEEITWLLWHMQQGQSMQQG